MFKGAGKHQGLRRPFSHFLHPKSWGRTAQHRKRADFDGSARKRPAGTLGGCQGALTLQSRKSGPFPALFSYVTPLMAGAFFFSVFYGGPVVVHRRFPAHALHIIFVKSAGLLPHIKHRVLPVIKIRSALEVIQIYPGKKSAISSAFSSFCSQPITLLRFTWQKKSAE